MQNTFAAGFGLNSHSPTDSEGQRNDDRGSFRCEHVMVTSLDKEFDVRSKADSATKVIATLVYVEIAGDGSARFADANVPELVARDGWNHAWRGQQELAIVKAVACGRVRTEAFLLDKFVRRVRCETPKSSNGTE